MPASGANIDQIYFEAWRLRLYVSIIILVLSFAFCDFAITDTDLLKFIVIKNLSAIT